jgi:hypothetical protein
MTKPSDREGRPAGQVLSPRWNDHDTFNLWPETGEILGLSRAATYAAAKRRELPVIWIGRRGIVPRRALERLLAGPEVTSA